MAIVLTFFSLIKKLAIDNIKSRKKNLSISFIKYLE